MCHSDTDPTSPRCARCNADIAEATVQDAPEPEPEQSAESAQSAPDEQSVALSPEPWAAETTPDTGPRERATPLAPEPWAADPGVVVPPPGDPWGAQGQSAPGGFREEVTSLSPEPWETPRGWDHPEPPMWQPPPPRRRRSRTGLYVLAGLGVWVLTVTAVAIVIWPSDEKSTANPPAATTLVEPSDPGSGTPVTSPSDTASTGAALEQATRINALLDDMVATRSQLGSVVAGGCDMSGLESIRDQRQEQLGTARSLQVDALDGGEELKSALTRALEISIESNNLYIANAPGCPSDEEADDVNTRASQAKAEVIQYWNPIASEHGLPTRSSDVI
ncbi:MAG TPA: hypothetical protein VHJ17_25955 [Thermomonospora sp.]|nr:hypothetical protein [Thermomonospora sp.]